MTALDNKLTAWQTPPLHKPGASARERLAELYREDLEALQEESRLAGHAAGLEQGLAEGREQVQRQLALLDELAASLANPLRDINRGVVDELVMLAGKIAGQLLRSEEVSAGAVVMSGVQDALACLGDDHPPVKISLAPADAVQLRQLPAYRELPQPWEIVEDPELASGQCHVICGATRINAGLQTRIDALVSDMVEDEIDAS